MSYVKSRATNEAVQKIMSSLKQFEKKLDKLQYDVSNHGQTLNDLKTIVFSISTGTLQNPDEKLNEFKSRDKKMTATGIQYDHEMKEPFEEAVKTRRRLSVQPLPSKVKAKTHSQGMVIPNNNSYRVCNKASSPRAIPAKHSHKSLRPSKAEAPRKATTLRTQKGMAKKLSNTTKSNNKTV